MAVQKSEIDIVALAKRMATRLQTQTSRHKIILDFPSDFPIVQGNDERLEQVFSNLISNAIKEYAPSGEIRIRGEVRPSFVIITVQDEGPGIAPQDIPYIFDRFYRSPEFSRSTKGAAWGLT